MNVIQKTRYNVMFNVQNAWFRSLSDLVDRSINKENENNKVIKIHTKLWFYFKMVVKNLKKLFILDKKIAPFSFNEENIHLVLFKILEYLDKINLHIFVRDFK